MTAAGTAVRTWRFGDDPAEVAAAIRRGAIVAVPTESSYGLAVDPTDAAAVARLFALKGRGAESALPVIGAGVEAFVGLGASPDDPALRWAAERWPAALSVIVTLERTIPAAAGDGTLAVRVPAHDRLRSLLAVLDRPLTATSANRSGEPPLLDPAAVGAWLAESGVDGLVLDGGLLAGGPPSTIVVWRAGELQVVRPGRYAIA